MVTAVFIIGWIWSIWWGLLILERTIVASDENANDDKEKDEEENMFWKSL